MDYTTARKSMVDCQIRPSDVASSALIDAMLLIPREIFLPKTKRSIAYGGEHLNIGEKRYLLDPRVFAKMVDVLNVQPTDYILDVGNTTGYSTAVLSRLAQTVVALEESHNLTKLAEDNLNAISCNNIVLKQGSLFEGVQEHAPYDAIFVNGAVAKKPTSLLQQLNPDKGRLVTIAVSEKGSYCELWQRSGSSFSSVRCFDASAPILPGFEPEQKFVF